MEQANNDILLKVCDLDVAYRKLKVLFNVSVEIRHGEVVAIVGRNGAGKTTLFRAISGFIKKEAGLITFREKRLGI